MAGASKEISNMEGLTSTGSLLSMVLSFASKFATVGIVYGWGYMNMSIAWLIGPVCLSVLRAQWRKDRDVKRLTSQAAMLTDEKKLVLSGMNELPSWVYFPDVDRAEWVNRILQKVWPSMNDYARELLKQTIEPIVISSLAEYNIKGFEFDRMVLGRIAPKVGGIKVYDKNTTRDEIVLDAQIVYKGNCDISFTVSNIKAGIKDFQISGMIRVVMKPLISVLPIVGGIQIFFLNKPSMDFDLVGAADLLDFPGFNETLRKVITEQVTAIMVSPNKLAIPISHEVGIEFLRTPEPEGVLRIHVVEAKHLMKKDIGMLGKGKSDPYAVITIGAETSKTPVIDNSVNPQWDYWCEFVVDEGSGHNTAVVTHLFDKDNTGKDDPLGRASIDVDHIQKKRKMDKWLTLEFAKHGMVHLRLTWFQLTTNLADLKHALAETQELRVTHMSSAVLILYVDSAENLPFSRGSKQPDVYVKMNVGSTEKRTTTVLRSCDPVWEQGFTLLVANPETDTLYVTAMDQNTNKSIGVMSYNIHDIMKENNLEVTQQPFDLHQSDVDSKIVLSMKLRILKYEPPEPTSEVEEDHDINEIDKQIVRQESNISSTPSTSISPSPLKKQPSKESVHSVASSMISAAGIVPATGLAEERALVDDIMIATTAPPPVDATPGLVHRNPSVTSSAGEAGLGRIQLTLRYSVARQKLFLVVHKVANLPLPQNDPSNIPDPYVKLYLLPDRHKETKRKTAVMKDNCSPVYDEQFEYIISQGDLNTRKLEVSVCTQKGWLSTGSNVMGQLYLNLSEMDLTQPITSWFDLMPEARD